MVIPGMARFLASILLAAALLSPPAIAAGDHAAGPPQAPALPSPSLHIRGGLWFDGSGFRPMEWYAVGGKLTAARPARVDAVIDLAGRHVLPPLAEAHNHDMQNAFTARMMAGRYLARGIFYSAQMAAAAKDVAPFRGLLGGPGAVDAVFANAVISASDGHPLAMALESYEAEGMKASADDIRDNAFWSVDTPADLDARWERIAASRPSLIKVILIDGANYAANRRKPELFGRNGIDPALLPEIVRRGHGIGARIVVHVDTAEDFRIAVAAGADIIAHLPGYRIAAGKTAADYRIADAAIAEAARRGTAVVTTTAASRYAIERRPESAKPILETYADNIRRLRAAGVRLALGSDVFGGSVVDEIETVDRLGVIPRPELLRIATADTARLLFPERRIGAFEEGAEASLIAVDGDPARDLSALRRVMLAVKQGELLSGR